MKKICQALLCIILLLSIVLIPTSCGSKASTKTPSSSSEETSDVESEDDFDDEESEPEETEDTKSNAASSKVTSSKTSSKSSGSSKASSQSTSSNAASSKELSWKQVLEQMPKDLKGTTIEIYSWNPASEAPGATKVISDFEKASGIKVKWTQGSYENYNTEIAARIAAQKSPDVVRMYLPWEETPGQISFLQPLSVSGYDFGDTAWDKDVMNAYSRKGKAYATNMKNTLLNQPGVMMYNKNIISKYDLDDPYSLWKQGKWTYKKFMDICKAYKSETNKSAWTVLNGQDYMAWLGLTGPIAFDGNSYSSALGDSKVIAAYQATCDLVQAGIIDKTLWNMSAFESGDIPFFSLSIISARRTHPWLTDMKSKGNLGVAPFPSIEGQNAYYQPFREMEAYGIPKGAKNAKAVPYFLRYYLDGNNYDQKTFFNDSTILEVYNFCMKQQKKVTSNAHDGDMTYELFGVPSAQVSAVLEKNAPTFKARANELNAILAKYK